MSEWHLVFYLGDILLLGGYSFIVIKLIMKVLKSIANDIFIVRYGLRGRELINNVGKAMLQGGGTFGTFMAIGSGIRC